MSKEHERELEKAESWDIGQPEVRESVKTSRVVVSVAFRRDDFVPVSECAKRSGKRISEFIREAAIEKATKREAMITPIEDAWCVFCGKPAYGPMLYMGGYWGVGRPSLAHASCVQGRLDKLLSPIV